MVEKTFSRLAWPIVVGLVLNGILGACLAALRLAGVIGGSWTLVLSPLWIPVAVATILELVLLQAIWNGGASRPREVAAPRVK
jgi:hypothetical protein